MTVEQDAPASAASLGSSVATVLNLIDGRGQPAVSGRTFNTSSPWSGHVIATVAASGAEDARLAIEAAHRAFAAWSQAPPAQRQAVFLRAAEAMERRRADIVELLAEETGCGSYFAQVQIDFSVSLLRQSAGLPYSATGQLLPSDIAGTTAMAVRRPVGVVGAIAPWNASLTLAGRAIAGPLALGNTVVLKPSEASPVTGGTLWGTLLAEAGLPDGVLNVVTHARGEAGAIGEELIGNPLVRRVNFTGSTPTGRRLAELAGRHLKRVVLQLSGHNPLIVLDGVDLNHAVNAAAYGAFVHQGQVCMCVRRIYVEKSIADEFALRFAEKASRLPMGDPTDPGTVIGPLIDKWALATISRRVDEAVALGARLLVGGAAEPPCYPATVLTDVPPHSELAMGENFGPVVILEVVANAEEAVHRANTSDFGLAAGVLAGSTDQGLELARRLSAGSVHVNDQPANDEPQMPFGGVKDSGWGRFGVTFGIDDFTELQWLTSRTTPREYPF